jgi:hypothetical protein
MAPCASVEATLGWHGRISTSRWSSRFSVHRNNHSIAHFERAAMSVVDPHVFEVMMLCCFGCSWPFAIAKTIRTKMVKGKSIVFIVLVFIGYVSGTVSKLVGKFDHVIWFYVLNGSMVFTEIVLYCRYHRPTNDHTIRIVKPKWEAPNRSEKNYGLNKTAG